MEMNWSLTASSTRSIASLTTATSPSTPIPSISHLYSVPPAHTFPAFNFRLSSDSEFPNSSPTFSTHVNTTAMDPWAHSSPVPAEYCSDNNSDPTDNTTLASQIIPAAEIRGMGYTTTGVHDSTNSACSYGSSTMESCPGGNTFQLIEDSSQQRELLQVQPRDTSLASRSHRHTVALADSLRNHSGNTPQVSEMIMASTPQHSNAQQYLSGMNEVLSSVRALVEDQQPSTSSHSASSASMFYPSLHSDNTLGHHQTINSALHQRSGYHLPPHLNLRRAQSMDAFVTQVPSFSLSPEVMISCNSSPGSPMTMLVSPHQNGSQRGHQHHGSYGGYFPASAGSSSPTLKDVSTDVNMSLEANVETIPICKVRSLTEGPEMTEYHHHHYQNQQQLHQAHIPLSAPFGISSHHKLDSASSPSLSSSLSSSFFSPSSASVSPSPPPSSPTMLSSSCPSSSDFAYADQRIHINSLPGMPCSTNDDIFSTRSSYSDNRQGEIYPDDTGNNRDNDNNKKPKARYVCQMPNCRRTFSRPFNLKSHGLSHETRRPHGCPQCPKTFARIHDRDRHVKGHLPEKAHCCIVCLGRFARQDAVTRHLKLANEQNPCAVILKSCGVSLREAAAGRVERRVLGAEGGVRRWLEALEEQARKARAGRNLEVGVMQISVSTGGSGGGYEGLGYGRGSSKGRYGVQDE